MTPQDLDALEKLDKWSSEWPHWQWTNAQNDALKVLIAELKEARGLITDIAASTITEDNPYLWKWASTALILARAFLARNGKEEG